MCGICGIFNNRSDAPADESLLRSMASSMVHRGPDDEGFYQDGALGLGVRRLSIIDLAGGHQPLSNEDGSIWLVCNGEIYNYQDLRRELQSRGHIFRTGTDIEPIVHAYEEWGLDAFTRLNGMYGLALWDSRRKELVLARDPYGIKPLYYTDRGDGFLFGSEIKALLTDPEIRRAVDHAALDDFLTFTFVPSPLTCFHGIKKLLPGSLLRVTQERIVLQRFRYRAVKSEARSEDEWLEVLRTEIEAAVRRQMIADVPVGAMLSGGMDSASVATLMSRVSNESVHTFTIGFDDGFPYNEIIQARRSAELIGTKHHDVTMSAEEYAQFMPRSLWYLEEPVATSSSLAFYWVCRLAREHVKVVLTGQGADEQFAGYPRHWGEYYGSWYRRLPAIIRKGVVVPFVERLQRGERLKRAVHSLDISDPLERFTRVYTIFDPNLKRLLYRPGLAEKQRLSQTEAVGKWQKDVRELDSLSQMLYIDARFSLPDGLLMYGDKMSMAASLEARVPYLDLELMALVEVLPSHLKIRGRNQKYILKRAAAAWIPQEIIRRKKIGFATPMDQWFESHLHGYLEDQLLSTDSACCHYFQPKQLRQMIADHKKHRQDYKRHLFSLLTFELWHGQFISVK
jgi:asparagine synthase (glutamine-hydrolysing)